ncbi:MAG TPA: winged helix-turn-helix domain-containing protein [Terriglobales bacterium]|nr:winged helix-turn-helix domain-containing protein [Terriglobales bacterium]
MATETITVYAFDDVTVDSRTCCVSKTGAPVQLEPKAFNLLVYLIENRDRVVGKTEILDVVWRDTAVSENVLSVTVAKLRKALGEDPKASRYIQTVHTRGYRFVAEVELRAANGTNGGSSSASATHGSAEHRAGQDAVDSGIVSAQTRRRDRLLILAGAVALAAVIAIFFLSNRQRQTLAAQSAAGRAATSSPVISIAVLPFRSAGGDDEYLGAEVADSLATKLSNSTHLRLIPGTIALRYDDPNHSAQAIGKDLHADYLIRGELPQSHAGMKVQLLRVGDGAQLWEDTFAGNLADIFHAEETIAGRVLNTLMVTLDHEERTRFSKRYTENLEAYEAFLRAHYYMNPASKEDIEKSIGYFKQAVSIDPKYAMAYAGLSDAYSRLSAFGVAPAEFVPRSRAAAMKALEVDETVAYAHSMLGRIAYLNDWDFTRADEEYKRTLQLEPSLKHQWYAPYLLSFNHATEAEVENKKFDDFLPFSPGIAVAQFYFFVRGYDRALDVTRRKLDLYPDNPAPHELLGEIYEAQQRYSEALAEIQKAVSLSNGNVGLGSLGHLYAVMGRRGDARTALQKLLRQTNVAYISPYQFALIHAGLGEKDKAIENLERAHAERSLSPASFRFDPRLENLRTEPRFRDFARSAGLPL